MDEYARRTPTSRRLYDRARKVFAGGVSHNARLYRPYPIFVSRAKGQNIWDEDGNKYADYWMGHTALILGHSPRIVTEALSGQARKGTLYGMSSRRSLELAEEIQRDVRCAERLRFCNTGAEATTYLVRLARAYTGRRMVLKIAGGWHGYGTALNSGVHRPFAGAEGAGILSGEQEFVRPVRFNDLDSAEKAFRGSRGDVAVIILEPVLGAGGCIPAERKYLRGLRDLSEREGALLAFDEVITGFRLALGGAQEAYGVTPDLAAFGKVAGGGMPIGVVCGSREIVGLADPTERKRFASIGGGTFSENPMTMAAGLATLRFLRRNRVRVYPRLEDEGNTLRDGIDKAFRSEGVEAHTAGAGSLFMTHFGRKPRSPEEVSARSRETTVALHTSLLSKGVFILPGHPAAISTAHTKRDLERLVTLAAGFAESLGTGKAKIGGRRSHLDLRQPGLHV